jgi:hypothetical protein
MPQNDSRRALVVRDGRDGNEIEDLDDPVIRTMSRRGRLWASR